MTFYEMTRYRVVLESLTSDINNFTDSETEDSHKGKISKKEISKAMKNISFIVKDILKDNIEEKKI